jgi:regulator of protease activity HflC (stomatin/prohibitin superfamily)
MVAVLVLLAVLVFLLLIVLPLALRVVPEYQRLAVFRLGRMIALKGPGLVILIPLVDRPTKVDLREFYFEIPRQTSFTKDNAPISIDFIIFYKVIDPSLSVLEVGNFAGAAQNIAATTLRSVVGDIPLDDVLAKRDQINEVLRTKLDDVTERWGVKVTSVEIREILPPPPVQEAMTRQMSAERTRRAVVTESEGNRQAAILNAEGDRRAAVLRAEGYATALTNINTAAATVDVKTMGLQYLDALKEIGSYPSTKFIFPMELTGLLGNISGAATQAFGDAGTPARPRGSH